MVRVQAVEVLEGFQVRLDFTDGSHRTLDLERLLTGPVFTPLRLNEELFRTVRVDQELGTLVWCNGADMDPDVLRGTRGPDWCEQPEP